MSPGHLDPAMRAALYGIPAPWSPVAPPPPPPPEELARREAAVAEARSIRRW